MVWTVASRENRGPLKESRFWGTLSQFWRVEAIASQIEFTQSSFHHIYLLLYSAYILTCMLASIAQGRVPTYFKLLFTLGSQYHTLIYTTTN